MDGQSFAIAPYDKGSSNYRVKRYRERAEELRSIAEDLKTDECHETLIRLAETYDQMAVQAGRLAG